MKKVIVLGLLSVVAPSFTLAAGSHPMGGCGLGYLLLSNKENTKVMQVLGATTNGTFGSQTFGISSGTSGCTEDGAVKLVKATEVYVEVNLDSIRRDMAVGQGEYVNTLASMLGASEANRATLVRYFQENYSAIFPTAEVNSAEVLQNMTAKLAEKPELLG